IIGDKEITRYIIKNTKSGNIIPYEKNKIFYTLIPSLTESIETNWAILNITPLNVYYKTFKSDTNTILLIVIYHQFHRLYQRINYKYCAMVNIWQNFSALIIYIKII
ncbi:hypothetical protein ACFLTE_07920, partial [Bacteroidota bacterium]